jgi:polar amino acid transport system substrate-binding protein
MNKHYIVFLILSFIYSHDSYSENITVVTEYLEPYQIKNDDGSLGGYMTEIVRSLFRISGDIPEISVMPWARAYQIAKTEKNVLIYSIVHTDERSEHFEWIGKVSVNNLFLWGLKNKFPRPMKSIKELNKYHIAVLRNSNVDKYLESHQFTNLRPLTLEVQLLKMLLLQRVDLIIGTEETILERLKKLDTPFSDITKVFELTDVNTNLSIAFNKNTTPQLVSRFKKAFVKLKKSGELDEIKKKWFKR